MEENKLIAALALIGGIAIGANWKKIKGFTKPYFASVNGAIAGGYNRLFGRSGRAGRKVAKATA